MITIDKISGTKKPKNKILTNFEKLQFLYLKMFSLALLLLQLLFDLKVFFYVAVITHHIDFGPKVISSLKYPTIKRAHI